LTALDEAAGADVLVKASGVGVFDALLERRVPETDAAVRVFWDVDAPATLGRLEQDPTDPFHELLPRYDLVLTYGGGEPVIDRYSALGVRRCVPVYNALDPETHFPVEPDDRFACDLAFLGNRLPDREARVEEFFLRAASHAEDATFLLGGNGWESRPLPQNVRYVGHVYTHDHNALNSTARAVLNVSRRSMAENGFSPATRVFEAAGAGACVISDEWPGLDEFLEPGREVLVARDGLEVASLVRGLDAGEARAIGAAARQRVVAEHTYAQRAELVDSILSAELAHA
jgi:spore maturation protein CgeB